MQCKKCGRECGNNSYCALCMSGAPISYASAPSMYDLPASSLAESSSPSEVKKPLFDAFPNAEEKISRTEKKSKAKQSDSGEINIFALMAMVFAFFHPLCGIAFSVIGLVKAKYYGNGKAMSWVSLIISLLMTVVIGYILIKEYSIHEVILDLFSF